MDKTKLLIDGYKCFGQSTEIMLNNITLLTGANSAGKSSIIQALLLSKKVSDLACGKTGKLTGKLNLFDNNYALELGTYIEIYHHNSKTGNILINYEGLSWTVTGENNDDNNSEVEVSIQTSESNPFAPDFQYLCAERIGPRYEYEKIANPSTCGCKGQYTANMIYNHTMDDIDVRRSYKTKEKVKWIIQFNEWVNYLFPELSVQVGVSEKHYWVKVHNDAAPNVGFGISYALPIIASGLLVEEGGMLIVENPEAHLHAKAQSNMGYFLSKIASAGVRVVMETHSEHIINGIRRMVVEKESQLSHNDVTTYFFHKDGENGQTIKEITLDEWGNLSTMPVDFFDQVRQDMLYIINIGRQKKGFQNGER